MALLTVKETSDVLGMPIKFVEDLMDKGKDGTKLKSKLIGKRKYIEIKPSALNYYKSQYNNKDSESLIQENTDLKNEIKINIIVIILRPLPILNSLLHLSSIWNPGILS